MGADKSQPACAYLIIEVHGTATSDEKHMAGAPLTQLTKDEIGEFHIERIWCMSADYLKRLPVGRECQHGTGHEIQHFRRKAWVDSDPKHVVHHEVCVSQLTDHPVLAAFVGGLSEEIAAEQEPSGNLLLFEGVD